MRWPCIQDETRQPQDKTRQDKARETRQETRQDKTRQETRQTRDKARDKTRQETNQEIRQDKICAQEMIVKVEVGHHGSRSTLRSPPRPPKAVARERKREREL